MSDISTLFDIKPVSQIGNIRQNIVGSLEELPIYECCVVVSSIIYSFVSVRRTMSWFGIQKPAADVRFSSESVMELTSTQQTWLAHIDASETFEGLAVDYAREGGLDARHFNQLDTRARHFNQLDTRA